MGQPLTEEGLSWVTLVDCTPIAPPTKTGEGLSTQKYTQNGSTIKFWRNSAENTSDFHDRQFTYSKTIESEFDLRRFKGLSPI